MACPECGHEGTSCPGTVRSAASCLWVDPDRWAIVQRIVAESLHAVRDHEEACPGDDCHANPGQYYEAAMVVEALESAGLSPR